MSVDKTIVAIEDYVGGNIEGVKDIDRMGFTVFLRHMLEALILEARIKELEALPKPDGTLTTTAYAIKVDYAIQDRLTQLKEQTNE